MRGGALLFLALSKQRSTIYSDPGGYKCYKFHGIARLCGRLKKVESKLFKRHEQKQALTGTFRRSVMSFNA